MRSKVLVFTSLAIIVVAVLVVASAVTVFALVGADPVQVDQTLEVAPVLAEPVSQPEVVKPVLSIEKADYAARGGGCPYNHAKTQLTETQNERIDDQLLTQVGP